MTAGNAALDRFARGDYHHVAVTGAPDEWQTHAALGLCGNIEPALAGLERLDSPQSRFYEGVLRWIGGDEHAAASLLAGCDDEHADNLLRLIRKPRISVLSQLPWQRPALGAHSLLEAGSSDPKFSIRNISFAEQDLQNEPDADIHNFYDASAPPDFYLSEMIEWHIIPPNLQELPCPTIGHTADYDMHVQTVYPWLQLFDEVIVSDSTEYADVVKLVKAPVSTFCKPLSLPINHMSEIHRERDLDLVVTGSLLHSYYPDKAEMVRQLLATKNLQPCFLSGFLPHFSYYPMLARSKVSIALTRHLGAIPSRGFEALSMGAVLLAPHESCIRLFAGEAEGVHPFSLRDNGLAKALETIMADHRRHIEGAAKGSASIRHNFNPWRVASQYLRMATFLAARPRPPRQPIAERPIQKRPVAYKGWLQHNGRQVHQAIRNASLARWRASDPKTLSLDAYTNPARELILEYVQRIQMPSDEDFAPLLAVALNIYRSAMDQFPDALSLHFNFVRTAFHFGGETDIAEAMTVARHTLARNIAALSLDPLDDVMTWDFCPDFFNYRRYLQVATEALSDGADRGAELKAILLASLNYYCGRMSEDSAFFAAAAAFDPTFSVYRLWHAKQLAAERDTAKEALALLAEVVREILYAPEAWTLMQSVKTSHDLPIADEVALRNIVVEMEERTLIDESYTAMRVGPYARSQRLSLARNTGTESVKKAEETRKPRLSVLLADTNGSRYPELLDSLRAQSLNRDLYEIIVCDVFDTVSPMAREVADMVILCGQDEHLYNRNAAFNAALLEAAGPFVAFFNEDGRLPEKALEGLFRHLEADRNTAFVNAGGDADRRDRICTVALSRDRAIEAGGLSESAYYAGAFSGPHELVARFRARHKPIVGLGILPRATAYADPMRHGAIESLYRQIWPEKFSPYRTMPLLENPEIARQRREAAIK